MKRRFQIIGLCAAILLAGAALFGRRAPGKWDEPWAVVLTWTSEQTGMVFVVRSIQTNQAAAPSLDWPIIGTTTGHSYWVPMDKSAKCVWFTVTAMDPQTGLESDFAW